MMKPNCEKHRDDMEQFEGSMGFLKRGANKEQLMLFPSWPQINTNGTLQLQYLRRNDLRPQTI